jgi:hypothetical protein
VSGILRCPDPECWTTYVTTDDGDTGFELMVHHYRYNMRHNDGKTFEEAAMAVAQRNLGARDV